MRRFGRMAWGSRVLGIPGPANVRRAGSTWGRGPIPGHCSQARLPRLPAATRGCQAAVGTMDAAQAAQMGEAVAQKVLQYRRDESGWKTCREGVSQSLGGKGVPEAPRPPLPAGACTQKRKRWHWIEEVTVGAVSIRETLSHCAPDPRPGEKHRPPSPLPWLRCPRRLSGAWRWGFTGPLPA